MTANNDIDVDVDVDTTGPGDTGGGFDDAPVNVYARKKSSAGLIFNLAIVGVVLGGGYMGLKTLGIHVPFIPGLGGHAAPRAQTAPQAADASPAQNPSAPTAAAENSAPAANGTVPPGAEAAAPLAGIDAAAPPAPEELPGSMPQPINPSNPAAALQNAAPQNPAAPAMTDGTVAPAPVGTEAAVPPAGTESAASPAGTEGAAPPALQDPNVQPVSGQDAQPPAGMGAATLPDQQNAVPKTETTATQPADLQPVAPATISPADVAAPVAPATPVTGSAAPVPAVGADTQAVSETDAHLNQLEQKISALEQRLSELRSQSVTKSDIDDLKAAITRLETGGVATAATRRAPEPAPARPKSRIKAARVTEDTSAPAPKKATTKKSGLAGKKKTANTHYNMHDSQKGASTSSDAGTAAPATAWKLKSAKPGMAWVQSKGSSDIQAISVGGYLPGVGTITSIGRDSSGLWVVQGTRGKINQ